jgi:signal transduction histidine kinase
MKKNLPFRHIFIYISLISALISLAVLIFINSDFYNKEAEFSIYTSLLLFIGLIFLLLFIIFLYLYIKLPKDFMNIVMEESKDGVFLLNFRYRIIHYNKKLLDIIKLSAIPEEKSKYKIVFRNIPGLISIIEQAVKLRQPINKEIHYENVPIKIRIIPLLIFNRFVYAYALFFSDKENTFYSKRTKQWAETVQKMAHDIKTPLSSVSVGLKTLQYEIGSENIAGKPAIFNEIKVMRDEINRVHKMTQSFLKFANLKEPKTQPADIHRVLQNAVNRFDSYFNNDINLTLNLEPQTGLFFFDKQQMEIVFNILLENAIEAMNGSGIIKITSALNNNITKGNSSYIELQISDNGPGIAKNKQSDIFEPYSTTKRNGTGMGLAIARKIIEDHNGNISVYSMTNHGTTFTITLPYITEK